MTTLTAEKREVAGKSALEKIRSEGKVPGVVYGAKQESTPIELNLKDFEKAWDEAGESTVVTLSGLDKELDVLIQEVAVDPVLDTPIHVDLFAVASDVAVEVSVPLLFEGVAPAEKTLGGTLVKVLYELEVSALPKHLPHDLTVDITPLATFDDQIHARDIALPQGVTLVTDPDEVVALVQEAVEEDLSAAAEGPDMESIATEERGKKEEEA
ncbi:50S ribosomal protein L25 [Patescibacteria group bacterium]|jgi:large subunit ribosomal protein L25|nr:50S ribosomal protein L25 [Patescibacteria group bacterium]